MADRHQRGMEAAIDRLEQVSEELVCHRDEHKVIIVREIKKVERKKMKIVKQRDGQVASRRTSRLATWTKRNEHMNCNDYTHSSAANNQDESGQQTVFHTS